MIAVASLRFPRTLSHTHCLLIEQIGKDSAAPHCTLHIAHCTLRMGIAHCTIRIAHYTLWIAHYALRVTHYELHITHRALHIAHCRSSLTHCVLIGQKEKDSAVKETSRKTGTRRCQHFCHIRYNGLYFTFITK